MEFSKGKIKAIENVLHLVIPGAIVRPPRTNKVGDYALAVFLDQKAYEQYLNNGYDTEEYILYQTDGDGPEDWWSFSYLVSDPGVMYHRDGSGTPPSEELVDRGVNYSNLRNCVYELVIFIHENRQNNFHQALSEWEMSYDRDLNSQDY